MTKAEKLEGARAARRTIYQAINSFAGLTHACDLAAHRITAFGESAKSLRKPKGRK